MMHTYSWGLIASSEAVHVNDATHSSWGTGTKSNAPVPILRCIPGMDFRSDSSAGHTLASRYTHQRCIPLVKAERM